jgi:hypothetical protein
MCDRRFVCFEQLVDLAVGELTTAPVVGQSALDGRVEVRQPATAFQPVLDMGECGVGVAALESAPEPVAQGDLVDPERPKCSASRGDGHACGA